MGAKRKILYTMVLVLFIHPWTIAQNSVVSNAIQSFSSGDYEMAYELAGDALVNIDALSGDYIPAAYYYLAKSRIQILRIALEEGNSEQLSGMQNALMESYYDYQEALKSANDQLKVDINRDLADLYNPILQTGLAALNTAKDNKLANNVRASAVQAALGYLDAAIRINRTYLACDLLGQARLLSGDTLDALQHFNSSIAAYRDHSPTPPDFLMAYVYFRKAIIERYHLKDHSRALASLIAGQNLLNMEYSRYGAGLMTAEERRSYDSGMMDLIGFELDIYLNDTTLRNDALVRFREVMNIYPEDYDIHISYANMLEDVDIRLAIDAYETAISIDDSRELGYFNLGALYNNIGSGLYLRGLNENNALKADSLYNEANNNFRAAYLNMEAAYQRNPRFLPAIRALVQLASSLGLDEKADFYKRKEMELRGF